MFITMLLLNLGKMQKASFSLKWVRLLSKQMTNFEINNKNSILAFLAEQRYVDFFLKTFFKSNS